MRQLFSICVLTLLGLMEHDIARAIDIRTLGKLELTVTVKGDSGEARPMDGADFDLTCTTPAAFSVRLRTDAAGRANTFARPGKCLLTSRTPVHVGGKAFSWRGNVELFKDQETRLQLSDENASIRDGSESPSATASSDQATEPSKDVALPEIVIKVEPVYPPGARKDRLRGNVVCQAVIGEDGYVREVRVLTSTNPVFDSSAIRAVSQRRYLPAQRAGRAIAIYFTVKLEYNAF